MKHIGLTHAKKTNNIIIVYGEGEI